MATKKKQKKETARKKPKESYGETMGEKLKRRLDDLKGDVLRIVRSRGKTRA